MRVLADQYLYRVREQIPEQFKVDLFDPHNGFPDEAPDYDALLVRTVTTVTPQTMPEAGNLRFVATATAGFDHIDRHHLKSIGVHFAHAEGCNANAVAEYVITVILCWAEQQGIDLRSKKIGIAGCGNTGGRAAGYLKRLGLEVFLYDPPKQNREKDFVSCSLDELLSCNVISFHTPLTDSGICPTRGMCSKRWLETGWDLLINTSRGGVVNEEELISAHERGDVKTMVTDVWEGEPQFRDELATRSLICTPHIAGYSAESKWLATKMVADQLAWFFDVPLSGAVVERGEMMAGKQREKLAALLSGDTRRSGSVLWTLTPIADYDRELRSLIGRSGTDKKRLFSSLRSETPLRSEFKTLFAEFAGDRSIPEIGKLFIHETCSVNL